MMNFRYKILSLISIFTIAQTQVDFLYNLNVSSISSLVEFPLNNSTFYTNIRPIKNLLLNNNWTRVKDQTKASLIFSFTNHGIDFESLDLLNLQPLISKVPGNLRKYLTFIQVRIN